MQQVGPFDNYLGVGTDFPSSEDVDFGLRAEALNVITWTTPRSIVYHTYGRRYGLKNVLKHHRGYATGNGALGAKLELWDHPLSKIWGQPQSIADNFRSLLRNPARYLLGRYKSRYIREGYQKYLAMYTLGSSRLSIPKQL